MRNILIFVVFTFFSAAIFGQDKDVLPTESYTLKSARKPGTADFVEVSLEVLGEVKQLTAEQKPVNDKMAVVAAFRYEERTDSLEPLESTRRYELAKAKMNIGDIAKMPELESKLKTVLCRIHDGDTTLFSAAGLLSSEQLLLIEGVPGNTLIVDRLLPEKPVKIGDSWTIDDATLGPFLYIDTVTKNDVKAILTSCPDNFAIVEIVGDVEGIYLGAATEIKVQIKYQFDLQNGRINWLGMLIDENRSIGHAGPGLGVKARLQAKILPLESPNLLKGVDTYKWAGETPKDAMQLRYESESRPWTFLHERSCYITQDEPKMTLLRMLSKGELLAQCTIADMGKVDYKTMTSLQSFKGDLKKGLGAIFRQFSSESERTNEFGYKEYRVEMDGVTDGIPLHWIYYLVTDKHGNQRVIAFVIESRNLEAFGDTDSRLMATFQIR